MGLYDPRSKSAGACTAKILRANAADMRQLADTLDHVADLYREGDLVVAQPLANHVYAMMAAFVQRWIEIKTVKERRKAAYENFRKLRGY